MSQPDTPAGHTPPDPAADVDPGVGRRLAEWTIAARAGAPVEVDPSDEPAHRRVVTAVEALLAHRPPAVEEPPR